MNITGKTKITGVFGCPVSHSLSPVFQNAGFRYLSLDYVYIPFELKPIDLKKGIEAIKIFSFKGVNLTIPHKRESFFLVDEVDDEAKLLGVINTIKNEEGKLIGFITDGQGFVRSIKEDGKMGIKNKKVYLFGAGGAAWAIAGALVKEGIQQLMLTNRTIEKAELLKTHLAKNFNFKQVKVISFEKRNEVNFDEVDILINTTSVGMKEGDPLLIDERRLKKPLFIYDIVYNRKTELIRLAEKLKFPHLDGLSMLVYQGAISFEIWTGEKAPVEIMKKSLIEFLKKQRRSNK